MHGASHPYRVDNSNSNINISSYSDSNSQRSPYKPADCSIHWRSENPPSVQSTAAKDRTLSRLATYPSYATPTSKPYPEYTPTPSKVRKCDTYEDQGACRHQSPPISGKTHLTPYLENASININHTTSSSSSSSSRSSSGPGLSSYSTSTSNLTSTSTSTSSSSISSGSGAAQDPYIDPIGWDIMTGIKQIASLKFLDFLLLQLSFFLFLILSFPYVMNLVGLLKTSRSGDIGIFNNACLVYQDSYMYGPYSTEALRCGEMFSIAMDSHKTGILVTDSEGLNNKVPKTPFYLEKGDSRKFGDREVLLCKTSHILGHIYALVEEHKKKVTLEYTERLDFELDPDLQLDDPSLQQGDDRALSAEWQIYLLEYKRKRQQVIEFEDAGASKDAFKRIDDHYKNLFKRSVESMKLKLLPTIQLNCSIASINDSLRERAIFLCRRHVALIVYMVTYCNERCKTWKPNFSFCWEICAPELHAIKLQKMLEKNNQSVTDLILSTQKSFF